MAIDVGKISRYKRPEDNFGFLLWQLMHMWERMLDVRLVKIDVTHIQFVILMGLAWMTRNGDRATQVDIATFCKISPALVSQVLRLLERKKLIVRTVDANDTRAKCVVLTPDGERRVEKAAGMLEEVDDQFFEPVGLTARERMKPMMLKLLQSRRSEPSWAGTEAKAKASVARNEIKQAGKKRASS